MNCAKCNSSIHDGTRFCGTCGAPAAPAAAPKAAPVSSAPATVVCVSCSAVLVAGARFCDACSKPQPDSGRPPAHVSAPAPRASEPEPSPPLTAPTPAALAEYRKIFEDRAADGLIEPAEEEFLQGARRRLNIPPLEHQKLMRKVFQAIPVELRHDLGRAHFVAGEASTITLRLGVRSGGQIDEFKLHYRCSTNKDQVCEPYEGENVSGARPRDFTLDVPFPERPGLYNIDGLLTVLFLDRRSFRASFEVSGLRFDPPASAGPQSVSINVDAGRAAAGSMNIGGNLQASRATGGIQRGGLDWADIELQPLSEPQADRWVSRHYRGSAGLNAHTPVPPRTPPPVPKPPQFVGAAWRCAGLHVEVQAAGEPRAREIWWMREDTVVFGRDTQRADLLLAREPWQDPANTGVSMTVSGRHLAVRRTDRGAVLEDLNSSCGSTVEGKRLAPNKPTDPAYAVTVDVARAVTLDVSAWRADDGSTHAVHVVRSNNLQNRSYLLASGGVGIWPARPGALGPRTLDGAMAPVQLVWHQGGPGVRNLSHSAATLDGAPLALGEAQFLRAGQVLRVGAVVIEVTDEVVGER